MLKSVSNVSSGSLDFLKLKAWSSLAACFKTTGVLEASLVLSQRYLVSPSVFTEGAAQVV
jgi:hypothetical protein